MSNIGFSSTLKIAGTELTGLVDISFPGFSLTKIETTALNQSTIDRTFIPGMSEGKMLEVEAYYTAANYVTVANLKGTQSVAFIASSPSKDTALTSLTPQTFTFSGFLEEIDAPKFDNNSLSKFKFKICVSGAVTLA